jgi:hypothetical protein
MEQSQMIEKQFEVKLFDATYNLDPRMQQVLNDKLGKMKEFFMSQL